MLARILLFLFFFGSAFFVCPIFADDDYLGTDLGNDIYRRLDTGVYKLKQQLIESRLKGSALELNMLVGKTCASQTEKILCFHDDIDFTATELEDLSRGLLGPIYAHLSSDVAGVNTELVVRMREILVKYHQQLQDNIAYDQRKLQSVGSIGLFTDGNRDNSSYDLMVDLENIHSVIFAKDIPYNGTANMGASAAHNLMAQVYDHPFLGLNPLDAVIGGNDPDPGVSLISRGSTGAIFASGNCAPLPLTNLDPNFLRDVQSQLLIGSNPNSSLAFADDAKLPEYWAKIAAGSKKGGLPGSAGIGNDAFPCSGKDIFCILVSMTNYSQNLFGGGKTPTIEYILDENLKIVNKFAPSSFVQSKMTNMFFGLDLVGLDLPSMAHIGAVVSRLPPPILKIKAGTTGGDAAGNSESTGEKDEFNQIIVGVFEERGLDFKRQNALLESNNESRMGHNLTYLNTNVVNEKSDTSGAPSRAGYILTKEMSLKKSYGDSFNNDLFELHAFTLSLSKSLMNVMSTIQEMYKIPQK